MTNNETLDWRDYGIYRTDRRHLPTDWQHVTTCGDSGGYEWTTFHAFYSPAERRYFWASGSGCSCNSWGDDLSTAADFENGTKDDLLRALRAFCDDYRYSVSAPQALDANRDIRTFRPKAPTLKERDLHTMSAGCVHWHHWCNDPDFEGVTCRDFGKWCSKCGQPWPCADSGARRGEDQ